MADLIKMLFSDPLPPKKYRVSKDKMWCLALLFVRICFILHSTIITNNSNSNNNKNNETSQKTYCLVSIIVSSMVCVLL